MSIYDARIQEEWQEEYNRKLKGEYYTVNSEKEPTALPDTVEYQMYHRKDYEFIGVKPVRKIIYKYHPIKHPEIYDKIYNKLSELVNKYPDLLTFEINKQTENKYASSYAPSLKVFYYGFSIYGLSTTLYYKWFKNIDPKINVYEFDISNQIFNDNMKLPIIPDDTYQYCDISNIYIDKFGELYISVTYKNNGISIFNTLNIKTEVLNARDIDKEYWLEPVYKCILCLETYLENINYKE